MIIFSDVYSKTARCVSLFHYPTSTATRRGAVAGRSSRRVKPKSRRMIPLAPRPRARDVEETSSSATTVDDREIRSSIANHRRDHRARSSRSQLDPALRPTFFELIAAERLVPSLKGALAYALGTLANAGAPTLAHSAMNRGEEVFALLTLCAELRAFASGDGSLAESVYGLQRVPRTLTKDRLRSDGRYRIDRMQRLGSALALALGPWARAKAAAAHARLAPSAYASGAGRRRRTFEADGEADFSGDERAVATVGDSEMVERDAGMSSAAQRAFVAAYPYANALIEAATFVTWTGYLLGQWNVNDPTLYFLDCYVARALPSELEANARELEATRRRALSRARAASNPATRAVSVGALRVKNFVMDYAQSALIAAVIGFKLTEWWYGAAEERVSGATTLPVPPPPPRPPPHPEGVALPDDPGACPLCRKMLRNPALLTCSGYVFCYACIHAHVVRRGDCPVSRHRAMNGVDDIRRVYEH